MEQSKSALAAASTSGQQADELTTGPIVIAVDVEDEE